MIAPTIAQRPVARRNVIRIIFVGCHPSPVSSQARPVLPHGNVVMQNVAEMGSAGKSENNMPVCSHEHKVYSGRCDAPQQHEWICNICLEEGAIHSALPFFGDLRRYSELKLQKDPNDAYALGAMKRLDEQHRAFWQRLSNPPDAPDERPRLSPNYTLSYEPVGFTLEAREELGEERIEQIRRQMVEYVASQQERILSIDSETLLMPIREEE